LNGADQELARTPYHELAISYLLGLHSVVENAVVVAVIIAGAPPGAGGDPDAGDLAVCVGLSDEGGQGLAVVTGGGQLGMVAVVLLRQARHFYLLIAITLTRYQCIHQPAMMTATTFIRSRLARS
jgi:hypothetical protein